MVPLRVALLVACSLVACRRAHPPERTPVAVSAPSASPPASASVVAPPRPEWTRATTMKKPPYDVPKGVANVVAHVPAGFDDTGKLHLVLFFHGAIQCAAQLAQLGEVICRPGQAPFGGYGYDLRHDDAATQSIFAIPQFAFFGGGSAGKMTEKGYFTGFVRELVEEIFAPGLPRAHTLDDVASITLIGHSAGFNPVLTILSRDELADKVRNVVLLDAMFAGGEDYYVQWWSRRRPEAPRRFVAVYGDSGDSHGHHANLKKLLAPTTPSLAYLPGGSLPEAIRTHDVVIAQRTVNHYWMPTILLPKVIAGLDLPGRTLAPRKLVDAPKPVPLSIGERHDDALDEGDARYDDGALVDEAHLTLAAGETVLLETRGGPSLTETCCTLDVLTEVWDGPTLLARDDDSAGAFDSRIFFRAPHAGTFAVRITTSGVGPRRGPYSLRVLHAPS